MLIRYYRKYIEGTVEKCIVVDKTITLCRLTNAVSHFLKVDTHVYITMRAVKHLYDKKPAEEFITVIQLIDKLIRYPDEIYKNKDGKRGDFCFVKEFNGIKYICAIEVKRKRLFVVTAFRLRKEKYLRQYKIHAFVELEGRRTPHRDAFVIPQEGTTSNPQ